MSRVPALLVMHGGLAAALLAAAEQVAGPIEGVETLSNLGLSRESLEAEISRRVEAWPEGGLVFTDFWGGSCHTCGLSASRGHRQIVVLTGLNLPALIDYVHNRDRYSVADLAERLRKKGQESIRLQSGQPA
jgi:mannose/fructose-specific phosphotransferase system component IIA